MERLIQVLLFSGFLPFTRSVSQEYVLIEDHKTWYEAQVYCKEKYFDLLIVQNVEEWTRLQETVQYALTSVAWIGMYNDINSWRWSYQDETITFVNWASGQPNNVANQECTVKEGSFWKDHTCTELLPFFCFKESGAERFVLITDIPRTWGDAQSYCRQHYTDLATIRTQAENDQLLTMMQSYVRVWIGLYRDSWKWSDGTNVISFIDWRSGEPDMTGISKPCGAAGPDGLIEDQLCSNVLPFICLVSAEKCMHCNGDDYRGTISITESGYTCQRWDSQTPNQHDYVLSLLPGLNLEENYCRNPEGSRRPWCYTTDLSKRWDYCSIPQCMTKPPTIEPELACTTGDGSFYRGNISVTKSGKICQRWSLQTPHTHDRTPEIYNCKGLEENYCRNPDKTEAPWCYTTDPDTRWEHCNVPGCGNQPIPDAEECMHCIGDDYRGTISTTKSGYTCQRWDSQTPHQHDYVLSLLPGMNLEENYCRNPEGSRRPWCYTTDLSERWDYCSIPQCMTKPHTIEPELACTTGDGSSYRGNISVTKSGKTCQSWSLQTPHTHDRTPEIYQCKGLEENYCRNPDKTEAPWCYTTDPDKRWEHCNVPSCGVSKKQIVRLVVKSDQNLNDPAVMESILQLIKQKLIGHGIEDTSLTWRLQPDGLVFSPQPNEINVNKKGCS